MSIYKLRNSFSVSADDAASLDIQFDGEMVAYWWAVSADMDADTEAFQVEVSFLSSNTLAANDARGSISTVQSSASGTPGFVVQDIAGGLTGLRIPVIAGERIHMHGVLTGAASVLAAFYMYVNDRTDPRLRRRR